MYMLPLSIHFLFFQGPASHILFMPALIAIFAHDKLLVTDNRAILIIC